MFLSSLGKFQLKEEKGQRQFPAQEGKCATNHLLQQPVPHCAHPDPGKHSHRGSASLGMEGALCTVATNLMGSQGNKLTHLSRPETISLANTLGRGLKLPHAIKIPKCRDFLQELALKLKVDYPMA